jgi:hypothetical protein
VPSNDLKRCVPARAFTILARAEDHSKAMIERARASIENFATTKGVDISNICFVVVGSVGRHEALEASDFDVIPVALIESALEQYRMNDAELRAKLATDLGVKVSKGEDLTKATTIGELTESDCIGGSNDSSGSLTKRILILTESRQVAGGFKLSDVREQILKAYANETRTSGRHVLSICNDIARYYKTLCIEYKAKIDEEEKDWCTRNMKLRHSRKLWYFSNILAIAKLSEEHPLGDDEYVRALLKIFDEPPAERVVRAQCSSQPTETGRLLENYAIFLEFMSKDKNRTALAKVEHEKRYAMEPDNQFLAMKLNSDVMHQTILAILHGLSPSMSNKVISWFLL